jgi:hypothetical protein
VRQLVRERRAISARPYEERGALARLHETGERPAREAIHVLPRADEEEVRRGIRGDAQRFAEECQYSHLRVDHRARERLPLLVGIRSTLEVQSQPALGTFRHAPIELAVAERFARQLTARRRPFTPGTRRSNECQRHRRTFDRLQQSRLRVTPTLLEES